MATRCFHIYKTLVQDQRKFTTEGEGFISGKLPMTEDKTAGAFEDSREHGIY